MSELASKMVYQIGSKQFREIDNAYHLAMIAENSRQVREYQRWALQSQLVSAAATLQAQRQSNQHLGAIERDCREMAETLGRIEGGLDDLNEGMDRLNETVQQGFAAVVERLEQISEQLMEVQESLVEMINILRRPNKTQADELRIEAFKWLKLGADVTGGDRGVYWNDATRLYRLAADNPIGMQDNQVWFHLGWLRWKHETNLPEAEKAFDRSRLLSVENQMSHVRSLRHLAHMQYLQGKFGNAYTTILKALKICREYEVLWDAARYAAKTGRQQESTDLLNECIDIWPAAIYTMFDEADFR